MSESPSNGSHPTDPKAPKTAAPYKRHDSGNAAGKWLAGAAAAAVLLGGGYYAVKNWPQGQNTEVASVDPAYDPNSPSYLGATSPGATSSTDSTSTVTTSAIDDPASSSATSATSASKSTTTRRTPAASNEVPETVIGVTPASITTDDSSNEVVVTANRRPVWVSTPSARRLTALYPTRALERGKEGEASVHCMVQQNGSLDCERASEYPANAGFGNAALRVASRFKHAPTRWDGTTAAGTPVNLRVVFRIEEENGRRRG